VSSDAPKPAPKPVQPADDKKKDDHKKDPPQ
jgi:hypothetical protein